MDCSGRNLSVIFGLNDITPLSRSIVMFSFVRVSLEEGSICYYRNHHSKVAKGIEMCIKLPMRLTNVMIRSSTLLLSVVASAI